MSQGLFTAASGITSNQSRLDVISDNIANINTIGFKSSQINFETVFSRQLSAGSPPTGTLGGINPKEIGLGVTIGEIGRNFSNGSIQTTGRSTDLNIQGEGFFTVQNYAGETLLTRAGNFTADANGNLVTSQGCKVMGTSSVTSTSGSSTHVQIPTKLNLTTPDATGTTIAVGNVGQLNGSTITAGTFTVTVDGGVAAPEDATVTILDTDTLESIRSKLETAIQATAEDADGDITVTIGGTNNNQLIISTPDLETVTFSGAVTDTSNFLSVMGFSSPTVNPGDFTITVGAAAAQTVTVASGDSISDIATKIQAAIVASGGDVDGDITVSVSNGQINIDTSQGASNEAIVLADVTSNFAAIAGLTGAAGTGYDTNFNKESGQLKDQSLVTIADADSTSDTYAVNSFSITNDGSIEVTYSNGAKLTVENDAANSSKQLKYTAPSGREISNTNITNNTSSLVPAQLQIQLASVINPKGLTAKGGNLYALTSVAGDPTFATGRAGGMGVINSGSLEASNVDLTQEFANMVLAQRGVEANSRTFDTINRVLQKIVMLGR